MFGFLLATPRFSDLFLLIWFQCFSFSVAFGSRSDFPPCDFDDASVTATLGSWHLQLPALGERCSAHSLGREPGHHSSTPWFWARGRTRPYGNPSMTQATIRAVAVDTLQGLHGTRARCLTLQLPVRTSPSSLSPASVSIGRFSLTLVYMDPLPSSSPMRVSIGRACLVSRCIPSGIRPPLFLPYVRVLAGLVSRCSSEVDVLFAILLGAVLAGFSPQSHAVLLKRIHLSGSVLASSPFSTVYLPLGFPGGASCPLKKLLHGAGHGSAASCSARCLCHLRAAPHERTVGSLMRYGSGDSSGTVTAALRRLVALGETSG